MVDPHSSGGYILEELFVGMTAEKQVEVTAARIAHGLLSASFGSAVVGTILPGAGSIYLGQTLSFHKPVRIGDVVVARVTVAAIDTEAARVVLRCEGFVDGELIMDGDATVRVPRRRRPARATD